MGRMRLALAFVLACGCTAARPGGGGDDDDMMGDAGGGGGGTNPMLVFDPSITHVVVEIDYETGNEPYTGPIVGFGDTFDPTLTNIDRVLAGKKMLAIPTTVDAMENVGAIDDEQITADDLFALRAAHRDTFSTATTRAYYVLFVSGYFADASGQKATVLGVSIGDTIVMFKDVIRSTNIVLAPNVVRYVEQSTLIHELAHSIGLTGNGVPLATMHKDAEHGPHCDNQDCVMFWQNDGSADATRFAQQKLLTGSSILFDAACLADVDAQTGAP
jgi:hypothetical protein